jgi:hypothetical protein
VKIRHLRGFSVFPHFFTEYIKVEVINHTLSKTPYKGEKSGIEAKGNFVKIRQRKPKEVTV